MISVDALFLILIEVVLIGTVAIVLLAWIEVKINLYIYNKQIEILSKGADKFTKDLVKNLKEKD